VLHLADIDHAIKGVQRAGLVLRSVEITAGGPGAQMQKKYYPTVMLEGYDAGKSLGGVTNVNSRRLRTPSCGSRSAFCRRDGRAFDFRLEHRRLTQWRTTRYTLNVRLKCRDMSVEEFVLGHI